MIRLVSYATDIPKDIVSKNLSFVHPEIGINKNIINSEADIVLENDDEFINIEINYTYNNIMKNNSYICQLYLRQIKNYKDYNNIKKIIQININSVDIFNENKFLYKSLVMEEESHKIRDKNLEIYDINLSFLESLGYNKLETDLERLMYFFICENNDLFKEIYKGDIVMENIREEADEVTRVLDSFLFYNKEELENAQRREAIKEDLEIEKEKLRKNMENEFKKKMEEELKKKMENQRKKMEEELKKKMEDEFKKKSEKVEKEKELEIAQKMLKNNIPIEKVSEITGISLEKLQSLD